MATISTPIVYSAELWYLGSDEEPGWWIESTWSAFHVNGGSDVCVKTEIAIGDFLFRFNDEVTHLGEENSFVPGYEYPHGPGRALKVRYKGASLGWSNWSVPVNF